MAIILDGTNGVVAPGTENFGDGTALGGATNPIVSMARSANNYVQAYIVNNTNGTSASADLVAYPSNGNDSHGWVDVGITAETYADATYTVTGPNESYLFGSAPTGSGTTGNLVYATDSTGTENAHQWYAGGFTQAKGAWKMQLNSSGLQLANALPIASGGTNSTATPTAGGAGYGTGTAHAYTAAGTAGQVLTSNGTSAPTWGPMISNQSTLVADGAITAAGKALILTAAGKVKQSAIAAASTGSSTDFNAAYTGMAAVVYHPVANVFIIVYQDTADSSKGKAKIATVASDNTVTFSSAFTFYNTAIASGSINACYDPVTNQVLITFSENVNSYVQVVAATVSGSTITYGTVGNTSLVGNEVGISYDTGVSKFLLAYRGGSAQYALVGTVSGTSVSFGSPTTVYGSSVNGYGSPAVYCTSISRHCIGYNTGGRGYIVQVTIAPSTYAITVGSAYPVTNGSGADGYLSGNHSLAWVDSLQRLLVVHSSGPTYNYYLQVTMFSQDSTSWIATAYTNIETTGSYSAPYQYWPSIDYSAYAGYAVVSYVNASSKTGYISYSSSLAASSVGFGTKTQFQSTATDMTGVAISTTTNKALVIAWDNSNPSPSANLNGTCAGSSAPLPDSRTSFIGFSIASAADGASVSFTTSFGVNSYQSGLTPNTTYYLDANDGTTLTTTVSGPKVARAISATSAQVLGPNCA